MVMKRFCDNCGKEIKYGQMYSNPGFKIVNNNSINVGKLERLNEICDNCTYEIYNFLELLKVKPAK